MLLSNCDFITVSQKIENKEERERLIQIVKQNLPKGMGAIVRTAAEKIDEDKIKTDINNLIEEWNRIETEYKKHKGKNIVKIYDNKALIRRTLVDTIDRGIEKVTVNSKKDFEFAKKILEKMEMTEQIKLELREKEDLIKAYDLESQIEKLKERLIWLKCGGYITIDKTEALVAIDVNTGKYTGKKNFEETVVKVNLEATKEIVKQLRLRDIGGIVIIDYIDMFDESNKDKILEELKECMKKDRTTFEIMGFTKLNLVELTRKNMCINEEY